MHTAWRGMTDDLDGSWSKVGPLLVLALKAGQVGAAKDSQAWALSSMADQGMGEPGASVAPAAFAVAWPLADGVTGSLDDLLYGSVITAKQAQADSLSQRLSVGRSWLDTVAQSQMADASRQATSTLVAATPRAGWVRVVNPPCCQRCAVLAGRFYRYSSGFKRHPGCDCGMQITTEADYGLVSPPLQARDVTDLTKAQHAAIDDGSDFNQVINAHRAGARPSDGMTTTYGTTARSGIVGRTNQRLTPEAIYKIAGSREQAVALLKKYGYIF